MSRSLDGALLEVSALCWQWKVPGFLKDKNGKLLLTETGEKIPRPVKEICPIASFDPASIRGLKPPPHGNDVRIPLAIQRGTGTYRWCAMTFWQIVQVYGLARPQALNLFAIMLEHHAQHFVIDLDGGVDAWPQLVGKEKEIEAEARVLFAEFYQTQFGATADMSGWFADAVPPPATGAARKTSLHINITTVAFKRTVDLHEFVLRWVKWMVQTHPGSCLVRPGATADELRSEDEFTKASPVDVTVYNADRNMRLSGSRKPNGLPLVPMDSQTSLADALWASLPAYSMPADPATWLSYTEHTECTAISPAAHSGKRKASAVPPIVVSSAESAAAASSDYSSFKGTICTLPPKESDDPEAGWSEVQDLPEKDTSAQLQRKDGQNVHKDSEAGCAMADHFAAAMREEWDAATFFRYMPHPKPEDVKLILTSLNQERRLLGSHDTWRNVVWAVKAACPSDAGYAIVEEWTKGGKPGSRRPGVLMKTWLSGKTDRFTVASLWKWAKEDLTGDAYRALWKRINPPEAMEAARKAASDLNEGALARVVESWQQTFGKRDEKKELVYELRKVAAPNEAAEELGDNGNGEMLETRELVYEVYHELPQREVMRWFAKIPTELLERIVEAGLTQELMERTVLPMCNVYWKFLKEKKQDRIFVKQQCVQAGDDRKFRWLEMTEKRFLGAALADFKLKGMHGAKESMAHVWLVWSARETYNGPACVPPTAREEQTPAPFQFNEWIGLKVSHDRARRDGNPKHKDWIDFKDYLWNAVLQGEPDKRVKEYFVKWYISQYVRPGYKLKVAMVLYSELNQIGKTELAKMMRVLLLGDTVGVECQSEDALDKFNGLIGGKLLVFLEEFARCKAYNDRFKIEITASSHNINDKNEKVFTEPNCGNWMVATNYKDAVDVNMFSKRVFIVLLLDGINTVLTKTGSPTGPADHASGNEFTFNYAQWKDREWNPVHIAAGMLEWAEELDLDNWDPSDIPMSRGAKLQMAAGEEKHDPVAAWWRKFVTNSARAEEVAWNNWNSVAALFKLFQDDNGDDKKLMADMSSANFSEAFGRRGFAKGNRWITADMKVKASFPQKQKNTQSFKLPTREVALQGLDVKMRAGRTEDEEGSAPPSV